MGSFIATREVRSLSRLRETVGKSAALSIQPAAIA